MLYEVITGYLNAQPLHDSACFPALFRQADDEPGAADTSRLNIQTSAMRLDIGKCISQPQSGPLFLGGKERLEDPVTRVFVDSYNFV